MRDAGGDRDEDRATAIAPRLTAMRRPVEQAELRRRSSTTASTSWAVPAMVVDERDADGDPLDGQRAMQPSAPSENDDDLEQREEERRAGVAERVERALHDEQDAERRRGRSRRR